MKTRHINLISIFCMILNTSCLDEPPKPDLNIYIKGKVTDKTTGKAIPNVACQVYKGNNTLMLATFTDANGTYNLKFLPKSKSNGGNNTLPYWIAYVTLNYQDSSCWITTTNCIKSIANIFGGCSSRKLNQYQEINAVLKKK